MSYAQQEKKYHHSFQTVININCHVQGRTRLKPRWLQAALSHPEAGWPIAGAVGRDESCETPQLTRPKLNMNWCSQMWFWSAFIFLTPSFHLANLISVIPTGIWGQLKWIEESDQQLHLWCIPIELPSENGKHQDLGIDTLSQEPAGYGTPNWKLDNIPQGNFCSFLFSIFRREK